MQWVGLSRAAEFFVTAIWKINGRQKETGEHGNITKRSTCVGACCSWAMGPFYREDTMIQKHGEVWKGAGQPVLCGPCLCTASWLLGTCGSLGKYGVPYGYSHELCLVPGISIAIPATCGPLSCYWGRTWIACVFRGQKILEKGNGKPKQRCITPFLGPWHLFLKICIFGSVCAGKHSLP